MALLRAAKKDEIPPGTIREFQLNGTTVAIANVDGKLYAINNVCLHRGGPLGEGELAGKIVTCPWHGWTYDVTTGKSTMNPAVGVSCYPIEIKGMMCSSRSAKCAGCRFARAFPPTSHHNFSKFSPHPCIVRAIQITDATSRSETPSLASIR